MVQKAVSPEKAARILATPAERGQPRNQAVAVFAEAGRQDFDLLQLETASVAVNSRMQVAQLEIGRDEGVGPAGRQLAKLVKILHAPAVERAGHVVGARTEGFPSRPSAAGGRRARAARRSRGSKVTGAFVGGPPGGGRDCRRAHSLPESRAPRWWRAATGLGGLAEAGGRLHEIEPVEKDLPLAAFTGGDRQLDRRQLLAASRRRWGPQANSKRLPRVRRSAKSAGSG